MQSSYIAGSNIFLAGDGLITMSQEMITDLPSTTVTIKTGKQVRSVWNYYGAPKRLIQIENKIKKLAKISGV